MTDWPASLPQCPRLGGVSGGPQRNKVSFKPEIGPTIDRRRGTAVGFVYELAFPPLTGAQFAAFEAFFNDDLAGGVTPYAWADPISGDAANWKFLDDHPAYRVEPIGGGRYSLSFRVMRLP